jgi:hypothetical protein
VIALDSETITMIQGVGLLDLGTRFVSASISTLLGLDLTLNWLGLWLEISIFESVSFCPAVSTSAEGSGTRDVAAYSIAS